MNILFFGDVVGRSGRDAVLESLPKLREEYNPDLVVVNVDNAAHGFGTTPAVCEQFFKAGIDILTGGDHIWDQKEIVSHISKEPRLLRPHNLPSINPGSGLYVHKCDNGTKIVIVHLLGQVFMKENAYCPFACIDEVLKQYILKANVSAIFVDFHAEATSEKNAFAQYVDGRVTAVIGSHTHVPTADARILGGGTAYITDAGMCGDYNSVIGFKKEAPIQRFVSKNTKHKLEVAAGEGKISAVMVSFDEKTGKSASIKHIF